MSKLHHIGAIDRKLHCFSSELVRELIPLSGRKPVNVAFAEG
jgi:hypothetical protein